jgi:hypothetical protein
MMGLLDERTYMNWVGIKLGEHRMAFEGNTIFDASSVSFVVIHCTCLHIKSITSQIIPILYQSLMNILRNFLRKASGLHSKPRRSLSLFSHLPSRHNEAQTSHPDLNQAS